MAKISFNSFNGSVPRMAPHLLGENASSEAIDCRFAHGTLQSWREPRHIQNLSAGTKTVYPAGCCMLEFDDCVDVVEGANTCKRYYTTGDQPWPAVMELDEDCVPTIKRLGVPCIYAAPSVIAGALNGAEEKDTEFRSYAYQYVDSYGNRGALSIGSEPLQIRDGQSAFVNGFTLPATGSWDITHIRLYRTVSGLQMGTEDANIFDTVWMFVAEIPVATVSYTDTQRNEDLASAIEEDDVLPPPEGLRGLTAITSMNALAGFEGRRLHFSSPNNYHDWRDYLTLDDEIRGIAESNGNIYVMTDGRPYVVQAEGDCKTVSCRKVLKMDVSLPAVGFGNRRIVATTFGAVYVTHEGLVGLQERSAPTLITSALYAPDDFFKLVPASLVLAFNDGYLFAFGGRKSFVLKLHGILTEGWAADTHSQLSDTDVIDAFVTRTGEFLLLKGGSLVEWDRGLTWRPHKWVSAEAVISPPIPLAAGLIHLDRSSERVTIRVDGRTLLDRDILRSQVFTLPRWSKGQRWQIELKGIATVKLITLASHMRGFT